MTIGYRLRSKYRFEFQFLTPTYKVGRITYFSHIYRLRHYHFLILGNKSFKSPFREIDKDGGGEGTYVPTSYSSMEVRLKFQVVWGMVGTV